MVLEFNLINFGIFINKLCLMFKLHLLFIFLLGHLVSFTQATQDTLLVAYTPAAPFIIENEDRLEGLNIWLWEKVATELNLKYTLEKMSFPDMLDSLKSSHVDISINPLSITSIRSMEMEFTHSYFASNATVAVAKVSSLNKFIGFVKGFFNLNFLRGLLVLLLIILCFGLLGWFFERKYNPSVFRTGPKGIWDGFWWSAVTLTTVGYGDKAPVSRAGKITALLLMFGGLLFISGLTASIASSLTVDQLAQNPDGFNAFKERKVGTIGQSSTEAFIQEHFFKDIRTYPDVAKGLTELKKGKIDAFLYDEPILKHIIQKDSALSDLELLPVQFDVQFYAFGLPKSHTQLEQLISQKILEIKETKEWEVVLNEYGLVEL
jgi:ABC-type amino acid transport substrate-binding protein